MINKIWLVIAVVWVSIAGCVQWKPVTLPGSDPTLDQQRRIEQKTDEANEAAKETKP